MERFHIGLLPLRTLPSRFLERLLLSANSNGTSVDSSKVGLARGTNTRISHDVSPHFRVGDDVHSGNHAPVATKPSVGVQPRRSARPSASQGSTRRSLICLQHSVLALWGIYSLYFNQVTKTRPSSIRNSYSVRSIGCLGRLLLFSLVCMLYSITIGQTDVRLCRRRRDVLYSDRTQTCFRDRIICCLKNEFILLYFP